MEANEANRKWLRKLLADQIPPGGTDEDTLFTDAELDYLLKEAATIYGAASVGWMIKAANIQANLQDIESYSVGDESYKFTTLKNSYEYALAMVKQYQQLDPTSDGAASIAVIGRITAAKECRHAKTIDLSRLQT